MIEKFNTLDIETVNEHRKLYKIVNNIIDELQDFKRLFNNLCHEVNELENRLCDLEQCPINDIEPIYKEIIERNVSSLGHHICRVENELKKLGKKAILKPDYDPDDVKFNKDTYIWTDHENTGKLFKEYLELCKKPIAKEGTFEWALIQMKKGKKISRVSWPNKDFIYFLDDSLKIRLGPSKLREVFPLEKLENSDILAIDWEIVD